MSGHSGGRNSVHSGEGEKRSVVRVPHANVQEQAATWKEKPGKQSATALAPGKESRAFAPGDIWWRLETFLVVKLGVRGAETHGG